MINNFVIRSLEKKRHQTARTLVIIVKDVISISVKMQLDL